MNGVVFKQSYKSRNISSTVTLNRKHLIYIATRPGAVHNKDCAFGLWGRLPGVPEPEVVNNLKLAKQAVTQASAGHTLWRAIISVDQDTAKRHDLYDRRTWEALVNEKIHVLADEMDIKQKDFCWLASMHYAKNHPHVHILYWDRSDAIHQEVLPPKRFEIMAEHVRAEFGREIYQEEIREQQDEQAAGQKELRLELRALLKEANLAEALDLSHVTRPVQDSLANSLAELASAVPTKGALKYAYLPPAYKARLDAFLDEVFSITDFRRLVKKYEAATGEISALYGNGDERAAFALKTARKELYKSLGNEVLNTIKEYRKELAVEAPVDRGELQILLQNTAAVILTADPLYQELLRQMPKERTPTGELLKDEAFRDGLYQLTNRVTNDIRVNARLHGYVEGRCEGLSKEEEKELWKTVSREARHMVNGLILERLREDAGYSRQAQADLVTNLLIRLLGDASRETGQRQARRDLLRHRRVLSKTAQRDRQAQQGQGGAWQGLEL